ncbi:MAG: phage tail tape measure protein [Methylotenera sp.]|nr:phage tail tape measure protein [Methylotenera sp.]
MNRDLTLSMKLYADATRFVSGLTSGENGVRKFSNTAKREFDALKVTLNSVEGKLASIGVTIGATAAIMQSARMDKTLTQIGQTAGTSEAEVSGLRKELFRMSKETGQPVDDLEQGFNNAVQAGLKFKEALPVIDATNKAVAVTSAKAETLTGALTVAASAFEFDLAKPNTAIKLLDQMTVAGRQGNAELENLSSIFGRIGPNAASAGFGFETTLAFIEGLSQIERQPERLATLADSTMRVFTNLKYMKDAQNSTGVKFFDEKGDRRDPLKVLADIKSQYDKINTERGRALFVQKAFGNADLDTIKGMRILLGGDMLNKVKAFSGEITNASGTLEKDLSKAIDNSVDQVGRLKTAFREAADGWARPINNAVANAIKFTMADKKDGGLGMDGNDMALAAGGGAIATLLATRYGGKAIGSIAGKFGNMGAGVATGKALETAAGVTPVYVVNMGEGGMGTGLPTAQGSGGKAAKTAGAASMLSRLSLGSAAIGATPLLAMYGVTKMAGDTSKDKERASALLGFTEKLNKLFGHDPDKAQREWRARKDQELNGTLTVKIDADGRATSSLKTNQPGMKINMANGPYMATN